MSKTKYQEYLICKERGHTPSGQITASIPPQNICAKCGTYYWYTEPELVEGMNKPEPPKPANLKRKRVK